MSQPARDKLSGVGLARRISNGLKGRFQAGTGRKKSGDLAEVFPEIDNLIGFQLLHKLKYIIAVDGRRKELALRFVTSLIN